jgi:shikimate dehydrogenase
MAGYGLIGYPLTHSFSPSYFAEKFKREGIEGHYELYPLSDISAFTELLQMHPEIEGLSVTIPYKSAIMPYLDALDDAAEQVGAVNCIHTHQQATKGYNTDIIGFEKSLQPLLLPTHQQALVLGSGGASKAVCYVLRKIGIHYDIVSRTGELTYEHITNDVVASHTLIINTTPLGMHPDIEAYPTLPYEAITSNHLLYDLIYNPEETAFLRKGKLQGATIKNGLEMLQLQAEASWEIWQANRL